jgi:hypothetical protein
VNHKEVMIVTPLRGSQVQYCVGLMMISGLYGGWVPLSGQSDIHHARNTLANSFLQNKQFNTLVWIDSDIGFTREDFIALLSSTEPLVSGLYTDKAQPPMPHCRDEEGQPVPLADIPQAGMLRTRFVPGGFLKVERRVFETIIEKQLVPSYNHGEYHQFYNGRIFNECLMSEDYSFSYLASTAGFQPWIDCGIRLDHDGRKFGC